MVQIVISVIWVPTDYRTAYLRAYILSVLFNNGMSFKTILHKNGCFVAIYLKGNLIETVCKSSSSSLAGDQCHTITTTRVSSIRNVGTYRVISMILLEYGNFDLKLSHYLKSAGYYLL